ncbi:MAG: hypothetical protein ACU0DK_12100 [Pseudooceanicola sp.]
MTGSIVAEFSETKDLPDHHPPKTGNCPETGFAGFFECWEAVNSLLTKEEQEFLGNGMKHAWMIGVLADLRTYALRNGLNDLAGKLEGAKDTAECLGSDRTEKRGGNAGFANDFLRPLARRAGGGR